MTSDIRMPPHSVESEQWLIGGLLIDPTAWDKVADVVAEADFYRDDHRRLFAAIRRLADTGQAVDASTVFTAVQRSVEVEQVGGIAYIGELANACPSAAGIRRHALIVAEKARLRSLEAFAVDVQELANAPGRETAQERIDRAAGRLLALAASSVGGTEPRRVGEVLGRVVDAIQERMERGGDVSGLATGLTDFDRLVDGLKPGDLVIVAGRPSMGKTAVAINIAENVAMAGAPVLVFSLEMSDTQLIQRSLSSVGGINSKALASGRLSEEQWTTVAAAMGRLHEAPLWIDQSAMISVGQMQARARRLKRKEGALGLVVIDYLQLMTADGNNRNEELGIITRGLKLMAKDLGCPVICLSQLSRKCEERADKRPMLSDLRESGSIEQDADVVVMMYRDDYYNEASQFKGLAEAIVRKNRMGECGTVMLTFQAEFSRFRDADKGAVMAAINASASEQKSRRRRASFDD